MRLLTGVLVFAVAATAHAQTGLPYPPLMPPVAGGLPSTVPFHTLMPPTPPVVVSGGYFLPYGPIEPPRTTRSTTPAVETRPQPPAPAPPAAPAPPPAPLPTPRAPDGPKQIYVIPNCYIGNVPPRAERLPPGCDITQVRILDVP